MEAAIDSNISYICNPDVVLREEDEAGALLFNPDTNQVKVVNATGLFIWNQFILGNDPASVAPIIKNSFEGATDEQVFADLAEFIQELHSTGFIGLVKEA